MNSPINQSDGSVQLYSPAPEGLFSLDFAARYVQLSRHLVLVCCKHGLVSPSIDPETGRFYFDRAAMRTLQQIAYLRTVHDINFAGIQLILSLKRKLDEARLLAHSAGDEDSWPPGTGATYWYTHHAGF